MAESASSPARFEGRIGRTLAESEPWFAEPPHPGEDAPNIVVVLLDYNAFDDHTIVESSIEVPTGDSTLTVRLRRTGSAAGTAEVAIDGETAGQAELPLFMRMISSVGASIGNDHGSPVSTRYEAPFPFSGTLHEFEMRLIARDDTDAAAARARAEMARQ